MHTSSCSYKALGSSFVLPGEDKRKMRYCILASDNLMSLASGHLTSLASGNLTFRTYGSGTARYPLAYLFASNTKHSMDELFQETNHTKFRPTASP